MTEEWAKVQGCDLDSKERIQTPFDDRVKNPNEKGYNLKCYEYTKDCAHRVIDCRSEGTHMKYVRYDARLAYWLFTGQLPIDTSLEFEESESEEQQLDDVVHDQPKEFMEKLHEIESSI